MLSDTRKSDLNISWTCHKWVAGFQCVLWSIIDKAGKVAAGKCNVKEASSLTIGHYTRSGSSPMRSPSPGSLAPFQQDIGLKLYALNSNEPNFRQST